MENASNKFEAHIFQRQEDQHACLRVAQFRKKLFIDNLQWKLASDGQLELDQFDTSEAIYATLHFEGALIGAFRAIRTDQPYLAEVVFPHLAVTRSYPKRPDTWEISRFGVCPETGQRDAANILYALMFHFALIRSAKSLVAVTDLVHERYLALHKIRTRRFGMPQAYATGSLEKNRLLVAGEIPLRGQDQSRIHHLLSNLNGVLIHDKTLVLGRQRIQA